MTKTPKEKEVKSRLRRGGLCSTGEVLDDESLTSANLVRPIEKIMKEAVKMIINSIYDMSFRTRRTFTKARPPLGPKTDQRRVGASCWFFEFNTRKCFHTIDQHRLVSILKEKIDNPKSAADFRDLSDHDEGSVGVAAGTGSVSASRIFRRVV
ncbi:hypothetical protein SDJN02_20819, partial [Cucurbita argyrosperma subsp. argyrosperma]